jgi:hypothetical protein
VPLFRSRPRSALLTAIISVDQDQWNVIWVGTGLKEPPKFNAPTLTEAAEQATVAAVARQAGSRRAPGGELQLAIYPWAYQKGGPIYRVTRESDQFTAHDGQSNEIAAGTLEDLVAALRREPSGKQGMLLWIRQFADLITLTRASMQPGTGLSGLYLR